MPDPFHLLVLVLFSLMFFIFGAFIAGGIISTSVSLTEGPANWVSAIGTVLAAAGTVSTLGFLVYQNTIQAQELKDERKKRENHEAKQQELLSFQKYEMHKAAFHSILDQLENDPHIKFYDREGLYESIFPKNSFEYCTIQSNNSSIIREIESKYNDIWIHVAKTLKSQDENHFIPLVTEYFFKVEVVSKLLRVNFLAVHEIGNLYYNIEDKKFVANVFNLRSSLHSLEAVIRRLSKFTDIPISLKGGEPLVSSYLFPFYKAILSPNCHAYTTDFEEYKPVLSIVIDTYVVLFETNGWGRSQLLIDTYHQIYRLISDAPRFIETFKSKDKVEKLVEQLLTGFRELLASSAVKNPTFMQIESELSNLYLRITA